MNSVKVYSMRSPRTGNPVANQFRIEESTKTKSITTFQSYNTIICKIIHTKENGYKIVLDNDALYYSRTTSKYLYQFLDDVSQFRGMSKKEILKAIENKKIKLKNLN
jgi:hypothetical protein